MKSPYQLIDQDPAHYEIMQLKSNLLILLLKAAQKSGASLEEYMDEDDVFVADALRGGDISGVSITELLQMAIRAGYTLDMAFDPNNTAKPLQMVVQGQIKEVE